ncbi:MAG: hypothetical protein HY848_16330 [Betaproteobacteria bacterium]|nr:hypothetical protein [Betaproteobacteria bacterium]
MTFAAHHRLFTADFADKACAKRDARPQRPSVLWRIFDAIIESRQQRANQEIAHHLLARSGGRLTDDIEHRITQSLFRGNLSFRE